MIFVDRYGWLWFEDATIVPIDYSSETYRLPDYPHYHVKLNKFPKVFDQYDQGFGDNIPRLTNTAGHWEVGLICVAEQPSDIEPTTVQEGPLVHNDQLPQQAVVVKKVRLVIRPPVTSGKRGQKPKVSPKRTRRSKVVYLFISIFSLIIAIREIFLQHR